MDLGSYIPAADVNVDFPALYLPAAAIGLFLLAAALGLFLPAAALGWYLPAAAQTQGGVDITADKPRVKARRVISPLIVML